jgi:hypothetical protein
MIIRATDDGSHLEEPDVFTELKVVGDEAAAGRLGRVEDGHLFIAPDALAALAGDLADDAAWRTSLGAMVSYALSKGWGDDEGNVRAHIEAGS